MKRCTIASNCFLLLVLLSAFSFSVQAGSPKSTCMRGDLVEVEPWYQNVIFNLEPTTSLEDRAASFAHWITFYLNYSNNTNSAAEYQYSKMILAHYGIDSHVMLEATGFSADSSGFHKFFNHCIFYTDTDKAFQQRLATYLLETTDQVRMRMLDIQPGPFRFWTETTKQRGVFLLVASNSSDSDLVLQSHIGGREKWTSTTSTIVRKKPRILHLNNKKKFVIPARTSRLTQEITTNYLWIDIRDQQKKILQSANPVSSEIQEAKPFIDQFYINEERPLEGTRLTLTWEVLGANEVFLSGGIDTKPAKGQLMIAPMETTDYIISSSNSAGTVSDTIHLEVERIYLSKAIVTLFTPTEGDAKLATTGVEINMYNLRDEVAASVKCGEGTEFNGKLTNYFGPFDLQMPSPVFKRDLIRGYFEIKATGFVADSWTMSPIIILTFTDGTEKKYFGYGNKVLTSNGESWIIKF